MFAKWNFVQRIISRIDQLENRMSQALDRLKQAVADANTSFSNELDAINAKLNNLSGGASADEIAAVTADIQALKTRIDTETTALTFKDPNAGNNGTTSAPPQG